MKKIYLLVLLLSSFSLQATTIVSDLDDTIKITNSADLGDASANGVFSTDVFTGMPQFLSEAKSYAQDLIVVTASPSVLASRVRSLFRKHRIDVEGLYLRNPIAEGSKNFKLRILKGLMANSQDDFIFIGDDVSYDAEVYSAMAKLYPERVKAVYIHNVLNRDVLKGTTQYWTSFDLTLREVLAGRMNLKAVAESLKAHLTEVKMKYIFPKFAHCPSELTTWEWQIQTIFIKEAQELSNKLTSYCKTRS
jgi:phosphatidate phosphatase APP1